MPKNFIALTLISNVLFPLPKTFLCACKSELYVCVKNLAISRQNPLSCCPKLHNLLPVSIRAEHIFSRFETALKTFVRQRKFFTFEEFSDYMKNL